MTVANLATGDTITETWVDSVTNACNGSSGTYTPTLTGMVIGTGGSATNTAAYQFLGGGSTSDTGILLVYGQVIFGTSGQTFPTAPTLTLPSGYTITAAVAQFGARRLGRASLYDNDLGISYDASVHWTSTTTFSPWMVRSTITTHTGTVQAYAHSTTLTTTTPMTWAAGDGIYWQIITPATRV